MPLSGTSGHQVGDGVHGLFRSTLTRAAGPQGSAPRAAAAAPCRIHPAAHASTEPWSTGQLREHLGGAVIAAGHGPERRTQGDTAALPARSRGCCWYQPFAARRDPGRPAGRRYVLCSRCTLSPSPHTPHAGRGLSSINCLPEAPVLLLCLPGIESGPGLAALVLAKGQGGAGCVLAKGRTPQFCVSPRWLLPASKRDVAVVPAAPSLGWMGPAGGRTPQRGVTAPKPTADVRPKLSPPVRARKGCSPGRPRSQGLLCFFVLPSCLGLQPSRSWDSRDTQSTVTKRRCRRTQTCSKKLPNKAIAPMLYLHQHHEHPLPTAV